MDVQKSAGGLAPGGFYKMGCQVKTLFLCREVLFFLASSPFIEPAQLIF